MNKFTTLINIGLNSDDTLLDTKRIKILNVICFFTIITASCFIFFDLTTSRVLISLLAIFTSIITLYLQYKQRRIIARVFFILFISSIIGVNANITSRGIHGEYEYLAIPLLTILFFDNKIVHYLTLAISIFLFYIPNLFLHIYEEENFGFFNTAFVFLAVFLFTITFKNLNQKNEQLLAEEKKKVESDKKLIEEQHNKLTELSQFKNKFFINLSHEIRTPLTLINGDIYHLESDKSTNLESLKRNIQSITNLVDDVIDLAKIEEQKLTLNLSQNTVNTCLQKQFKMFENVFHEKNISFELRLLKEDTLINIDALYFGRAVSNILHNALKYTPEKGKISLAASLKQHQVEIQITDNGIGIPANMLSKVFNRFEQVDNDINDTSGSGIGLSFTQQVIKAHNGTLRVSSDNKTIFTITLDTIENIAEEIVSLSLPTSTNSEVIFIVDDNKKISEYLKQIFKNDTCYLFTDGKQALKAIPKYNPACIISDYMMPNMNGYELIIKIKESGYTIPTIILTGIIDHTLKLEILKFGVDDYLTKPFNEEELKLKVRHLIRNNNQRLEFVSNDPKPIDLSNEDNFLNHLNEIVSNNIQNTRFGTNEIADILSISNSTLLRKIKSLTGLSPKQYVLRIKLEKAKEYIKDHPSTSIKEVSLSVGISNQSRFAKQYEEYFGKKP